MDAATSRAIEGYSSKGLGLVLNRAMLAATLKDHGLAKIYEYSPKAVRVLKSMGNRLESRVILDRSRGCSETKLQWPTHGK